MPLRVRFRKRMSHAVVLFWENFTYYKRHYYSKSIDKISEYCYTCIVIIVKISRKEKLYEKDTILYAACCTAPFRVCFLLLR